MAQKVADVMWEMLASAGVKRCYGIVGDALNPVIDALRRNTGNIEFIHVRHGEYGVFAAVADAYFSGNPVVVCGTAGPGVTHLFNGLGRTILWRRSFARQCALMRLRLRAKNRYSRELRGCTDRPFHASLQPAQRPRLLAASEFSPPS
jgi:hypothetical protein